MISRIAITLLLALGACVQPPPTTVSGTDLGGVVEFRTSTQDAINTAAAYCQKYGKTARPTQMDVMGYLTFSCERS